MDNLAINNSCSMNIIQPITIEWKPQIDITAYELAQLLPILLGHRMLTPHDLPKDERLLRHLVIDDPNR